MRTSVKLGAGLTSAAVMATLAAGVATATVSGPRQGRRAWIVGRAPAGPDPPSARRGPAGPGGGRRDGRCGQEHPAGGTCPGWNSVVLHALNQELIEPGVNVLKVPLTLTV